MNKNNLDEIKSYLEKLYGTAEYDYGYLIMLGILTKDLKGVNLELTSCINPFPDTSDGRINKYAVTVKEVAFNKDNEVWQKAIELEKSANGDLEVFKEGLFNLLFSELHCKVKDEEKVARAVTMVVDKIIDKMQFHYLDTDEEFITGDFKMGVVSNIFSFEKRTSIMRETFPAEYDDSGVITMGVCGTISENVCEYLRSKLIPAAVISGIGELSHAWVGCIIDGKMYSIDVSKAIVDRDNGKDGTVWLFDEFEEAFLRQPTRQINRVAGKKLSKPMRHDNFNYDDLMGCINGSYNYVYGDTEEPTI